MIEITKGEKDYLLANHCYWHTHIFASTTRRHYYAREDERILSLLAQRRGVTIPRLTRG